MVRLKGAASGRRTDLLRKLRCETNGELDVREARFLLNLYERNELALSPDELVKYTTLNLSSSRDSEEMVMPRFDEEEEDDDDKRELVSVIVPTTGQRHAFHEFLYGCFSWQSYPRKEMLILDTAREPSPFFQSLRDPRVSYFHEPHCRDKSTGAKRNELAKRARGSILSHFDDDDIYAPTYLEKMVRALRRADFVKLSSWLWLDTERFVKGDQDCVAWFDSFVDRAVGFDAQHSAAGWHSRKWGYGFTYVYRKCVLSNVEFPRTFFGEDYDFFMRICDLYKCVAFQDDHSDIQVIHLIHNDNSSVVSKHKVFSLTDLDHLFSTHPDLVRSHLLKMRLRVFSQGPPT